MRHPRHFRLGQGRTSRPRVIGVWVVDCGVTDSELLSSPHFSGYTPSDFGIEPTPGYLSSPHFSGYAPSDGA